MKTIHELQQLMTLPFDENFCDKFNKKKIQFTIDSKLFKTTLQVPKSLSNFRNGSQF